MCYYNKVNIPLWDLESDYHLHNKLLRPPEPYVNKVLFEEISSDNKIFLNPLVKQMNEVVIRRAFTILFEQQQPAVKKLPFVFLSCPSNASQTETNLINKLTENSEIVHFLRSFQPPAIELSSLFRRYYIRSIATAEKSNSRSLVHSTSGHASTQSWAALEAMDIPQASAKWGKFRSVFLISLLYSVVHLNFIDRKRPCRMQWRLLLD